MSDRIIFDVDGTLVDSSDRLYRLFCDLTYDYRLTKDAYWALKRSKHSHEVILKDLFRWSDDRIVDFKSNWMSLIETAKYIALDKPYLSSRRVLESLAAAGKELYVLTARQDNDIVRDELKRYGLFDFLKDILVTGLHRDKKETLLSALGILRLQDIVVGDTGHDVRLARAVNATSVVVDYGFINHECLLTYAPDYILSDLTQILRITGG